MVYLLFAGLVVLVDHCLAFVVAYVCSSDFFSVVYFCLFFSVAAAVAVGILGP